jgi:hypothetical protein
MQHKTNGLNQTYLDISQSLLDCSHHLRPGRQFLLRYHEDHNRSLLSYRLHIVGDHHLILKKANLSDQYVSERNSKVPISEVPKVPVVQHTHTGTSRIARATEVGVPRETSMSDYTELQEKDRDDELTLESEWTEVQKRTRKVHFAANVPVDVPQVLVKNIEQANSLYQDNVSDNYS